jgi:small subunit ribosomal protein S23
MGKKAVKSLRPKAPKPAPLPGFELYDKIRRQFYEDHKFEAFRGINLVEADGVVQDGSKPGPKGKEWSELRQRSINPSSEEYALLHSRLAPI